MSLLKGLTGGAFLFVNKSLLKVLGGDAYQAILLTELITLDDFFSTTDQMKYNHNWFFRSVKDIERDTGINDYKQRTAFDALEILGLIETKRAGRPAKRFFRLNTMGIWNLLKPEFEEPVITVTEELSKKQKQDIFYLEMNASIRESFDAFKSKIGNIKKPFAAFMYTWSLLYLKKFNEDWEWSSPTFGRLSVHWGKRANKDFDYSTLAAFFDQLPSPENVIPRWFEYSKNVFEKSPTEKILDPSQYWS